MTVRTVLTIAALTIHESSRRRVLRALVAMTLVLLALSAFGFSRIDAEFSGLTSGEARLIASIVVNLVMFGLSLIAAIGTAFLAGPTVAGEVESGQALALLARPVRRSAVLFGKWLGLVAVGLFGATWVAGVVGGIGGALGNEGVERVGTVSRVLLPTDGLWRGAMNAFQDPIALVQMGPGEGGFPFLSEATLSPAYLAWAAVWLAMVWGLTALSFSRRHVQIDRPRSTPHPA